MSENKLSVELEINGMGTAESVLGSFRSKLENTEKAINNLGSSKSVLSSFKTEVTSLTKQTDVLHKSFGSVVAQRLNAGQVNSFTRELVQASERARQLAADIANIKREMARPQQKPGTQLSLASELAEAQREADQLKRKFNTLPENVRNAANPNKLSQFQKTNLGYQINDVVTGLTSGQDLTQILAQQGGQILQIFEPAQIAAFAAAYGGLVTILGAGTVAIAATYKITGDIRKEAERRLKVEENLAGAYGKQQTALRQTLSDFAELRRQEAFNRQFLGSIQTDSIDQLKDRRGRLEQRLALNPSDTESLKTQISALDDQIFNTQQQKKAAEDNAFRQRAVNFERNQENAAAAERKRAQETAKKIETVNNKLLEMQKSASSALDIIAAKAGADNPFVRVYSEAGKAIDEIREKTKGLSEDITNSFLAMQRQQNSLELFSARLENKFKSAELRRDAEKFRNPSDPKGAAEMQQKGFEAVAGSGYDWFKNPAAVIERENTLRRLRAGEITQEQADQIKARRDEDIYQFSILDSFSNLSGSKNSTFNSVNQQAAISYLAGRARKSQGSEQNKDIAEQIREKINLAQSAGAQTPEERSLVNRKIIEATRGVDPSTLPYDLRNAAAAARESEANKTDNQEKEANRKRDEQIDLLTKLNQELVKMIPNAGNVESLIRIIDETGGKIETKLGSRPNQSDVKKLFQY